MSNRIASPIIPALTALFAVVAFLTALNFAFPSKSTSTNTVACTKESKICPDGSTVGRQGRNCAFAACPTVNTNSVPANTNSTLNTNRPVNADTNVPIINSPETTLAMYSVAEAMQNASALNGKILCIHGYFQNSFEFNAFGSDKRIDASGQSQVTEPYIWVDYAVPMNPNNCSGSTGDRGKICFATLTSCGVFHYAAPGQTGFGHVNAYRFELTDQR